MKSKANRRKPDAAGKRAGRPKPPSSSRKAPRPTEKRRAAAPATKRTGSRTPAKKAAPPTRPATPKAGRGAPKAKPNPQAPSRSTSAAARKAATAGRPPAAASSKAKPHTAAAPDARKAVPRGGESAGPAKGKAAELRVAVTPAAKAAANRQVRVTHPAAPPPVKLGGQAPATAQPAKRVRSPRPAGAAQPRPAGGGAGGGPRVEIAPRRHVSVAPSLPLPVQAPTKKPTLQQRARRIDVRLAQQDAEFQDRYRESFDMSWVYHDAALEGVVYTFAELSSALAKESVAPLDSTLAPIYESIVRQKVTIEFVRDLATKKRMPLTVDTIRSIYVLLHPEEGDVKTAKYRRDVPQHRLYFHEYAPPDKINYRIRQVVDWLNDPETRKKVGVLRMAAKAHYDIARTYPFPTDSGKVARLFMNVLLMRGGLPPAIFHAAERQRYYEALKAASPSSLFHMLRDSVENSMASIEKLLDEHETRKRAFIS